MKFPLIPLLWIALAPAIAAAELGPITFETEFIRYTISSSALNLAFVDRATGTNYLATNTPSACAMVQVGTRSVAASLASLDQGLLTLQFGYTDIKAVLRTEVRGSRVVFRVESITGGEVDELTFLNVPLTIQGKPEESFGACALALSLPTRVDALPALQTHLSAKAQKRFGLVGAKVAIVGAPMPKLLPAMQTTLAEASELPVCRVAGPWAREIPFNHGSYLFNFGALTEANVQDWIEMTRSLGFTQIDNHGGGSFFRFGDFELNRQQCPDGWAAWERINARLHDAGIGTIFHTYAFFIDKRSKYVTPVPDSRLAAFRTFTLAEPLSADATEIVVNESTAGLSTVTGFFEHNSVVLHLGDELVTFGGVSQTAPWRFTGVTRGAFGTKAAAHERNSSARHLKELFGLLVPDPESSLFEEIAANHADVVNRCGFDGIYLDAIDGSSILRGGEEAWYWASKFVVEIQKRLKRPVGMEMSAMWHHFWQYRTRWQAWDFPRRGQQRFIDLHVEKVNGGLLLPLHLGWWGFWTYDPPQVEPSYPDVIEQLGARLIGWDAGISLTAGVNREALRQTPLFQRAVETLRTCEELRHAHAFNEAACAKLREPGSEFALCKNAAGQTRFRRIQSHAQTIALAEPWTLSWRVTNTFAAHPVRFRLETLSSVATSMASNSVGIADLGKDSPTTWKRTTAEGVKFQLSAAEASDSPAVITATNAGKIARNAAWARLEKRFDPPLNLKQTQALTVEVEGDGSGALLALRLESPSHLAYGAVADRYVTLDFTGRRRFTLVETESSRWSDYVWNDGKHYYHAYRECVDFGAVESLSVWLQNLPPGCETRVPLGAIRAVPLLGGTVKNPKLKVAGAELEFPVALESGCWIEANGPEDCAVFGPKGEPRGKVSPRGQWPALPAGAGVVEFNCETSLNAEPRARVTIFGQGETL